MKEYDDMKDPGEERQETAPLPEEAAEEPRQEPPAPAEPRQEERQQAAPAQEPPRQEPPGQQPPQGCGYYAPPQNPGGSWQGGRYQPWPGSDPWHGPNTTGWQQPPRQGYRPQGQPAPEGAEPPKKKRGAGRVLLRLLGAVLALAVVAMAGYGIYAALTGENPLAPAPEAPQSSAPSQNSVPEVILNDKPFGAEDRYDGSGNGSLSNTEIYDKVSPSVVGVVSYLSGSYYGSENQGSGIIMSEDGYIITNAHVVEGGVSFEVVLTNGEAYPASLVGSDANSDLAVLKVEETGLTYAEFGNSDQLKVGERVCAIGNPTGLRLQSSLTVGYVSALGRTISSGGYAMDCIQTDAAINPGNSGGPLINAYGQVIGINSAKIADTEFEGIGFAIPITDAMPIIEELIANGKVTGRAMLGITATAVSAGEAEYYQIPLGLWVVSVNPGADIGAQGVREGDIITHIDGTPIYSLEACSTILSEHRPGDTVEITVFRRESATRDNTFSVNIILSGS